MCCHCSFVASPILAPVSFMSCRAVAKVFDAPLIRLSISCSVGMNGSSVVSVYLGRSHVLFMYFRNIV